MNKIVITFVVCVIFTSTLASSVAPALPLFSFSSFMKKIIESGTNLQQHPANKTIIQGSNHLPQLSMSNPVRSRPYAPNKAKPKISHAAKNATRSPPIPEDRSCDWDPPSKFWYAAVECVEDCHGRNLDFYCDGPRCICIPWKHTTPKSKKKPTRTKKLLDQKKDLLKKLLKEPKRKGK